MGGERDEVDRAGDPGRAPIAEGLGAQQPDAAHLDEDAEALEDPVHCGDAIHQHELHEQQRRPAD
jgi:hypothetical protein